MQGIFRRFYSNFKEYIIVAALLIISLSLLSINDKPEIKKIRTFALGSFAIFNSFIYDFAELFSPQDKLIEARKQNAELMLKLNKIREYGLENYELRNLLDFKDTSKYSLIPGSIVSRLVSKVQGTFILNIGISDSVDVGMPVINDKGFAGIITDVTNNFSVVRTIENSNLKLAVRDQRSNVNGILNWDGIQLIIKNIPTTDDVKPGDRVVTSAFSTIVPPEIPVGIVLKKETTISGLLSNVIVEPYANLKALRNVFVMKLVQSKQVDSLELNLLKKE